MFMYGQVTESHCVILNLKLFLNEHMNGGTHDDDMKKKILNDE